MSEKTRLEKITARCQGWQKSYEYAEEAHRSSLKKNPAFALRDIETLLKAFARKEIADQVIGYTDESRKLEFLGYTGEGRSIEVIERILKSRLLDGAAYSSTSTSPINDMLEKARLSAFAQLLMD